MPKVKVKKISEAELKQTIARYEGYHRELDKFEADIHKLRLRMRSFLDQQKTKEALEKIVNIKE